MNDLSKNGKVVQNPVQTQIMEQRILFRDNASAFNPLEA